MALREASVRVERISPTRTRLEGDYDALYHTLSAMRVDGVLVRIAEVEDRPESQTATMVVDLRPALAGPAAESPSPSTPKRSPGPRLSSRTRRLVALASLSLVACGLAIGTLYALILAARWFWQYVILPHIPDIITGLIFVFLISGYLVYRKARSIPVPTPKADVGTVVEHKSKLTGKTVAASVRVQDPPVPDPVPAEAPKQGFFSWLGRPGSPDPAPQIAAEPGLDEFTSRWLKVLRDPRTGQSVGRWRGQEIDYAKWDNGDYSDVLNDDMCALGHALNLDDPDGWRGGRRRVHHSLPKLRDKYGAKLIKDVQRMNDSGTPLPKIADHVERKLRRRGW